MNVRAACTDAAFAPRVCVAVVAVAPYRVSRCGQCSMRFRHSSHQRDRCGCSCAIGRSFPVSSWAVRVFAADCFTANLGRVGGTHGPLLNRPDDFHRPCDMAVGSPNAKCASRFAIAVDMCSPHLRHSRKRRHTSAMRSVVNPLRAEYAPVNVITSHPPFCLFAPRPKRARAVSASSAGAPFDHRVIRDRTVADHTVRSRIPPRGAEPVARTVPPPHVRQSSRARPGPG